MLDRNAMRARLTDAPGSTIDIHTHVGISLGAFLTDSFPYCLSAEDLALRMELTGIDFAACFPMLYSEFFTVESWKAGKLQPDPKARGKCPYDYENRRLLMEIFEAFPQYADRLLPFAFFDPGRKQAEQVAVLTELAAAYPLYGIKTASSYLQSHVIELLDTGSCLLDFIAGQDIPCTIHSAVIPSDPWANVRDIVAVARARPDVRFAIAHACRFDRWSLDAAAELDNCFVDLSALHIHCLLAVDDHVGVACGAERFEADYRDPVDVMQRLAEAYPDTIIWGTDMPANLWKNRFVDEDGNEAWMDLPCEPKAEAEALRRLPRATQKRIAHDNCLRYLFGTDGSLFNEGDTSYESATP